MSMITIVLHVATTVCSLLILGVAVFEIYSTGHVFKALATSFPSSRYIFFESAYVDPNSWDPKWHSVNLTYDWSTENFVWVAAGLSVAAGIVGLAKEGVHLWKRIRNRGIKISRSTRGALFITTLVLAAGACFVSFIAVIFAKVHRDNLERKTCHPSLGTVPDANLICTRELAACNMLPYLSRWEVDVRLAACSETKLIRNLLVPLTILAAMLVSGYVLQMLLNKRHEDTAGYIEARLEQEKIGDVEEQWETLPVEDSKVGHQEEQWETLPVEHSTTKDQKQQWESIPEKVKF